MKKGEGTALVLIPVVKVTDLSESFGLVGSCLDSHPADPGSIPGVGGHPHLHGRDLSF